MCIPTQRHYNPNTLLDSPRIVTAIVKVSNKPKKIINLTTNGDTPPNHNTKNIQVNKSHDLEG